MTVVCSLGGTADLPSSYDPLAIHLGKLKLDIHLVIIAEIID